MASTPTITCASRHAIVGTGGGSGSGYANSTVNGPVPGCPPRCADARSTPAARAPRSTRCPSGRRSGDAAAWSSATPAARTAAWSSRVWWRSWPHASGAHRHIRRTTLRSGAGHRAHLVADVYGALMHHRPAHGEHAAALPVDPPQHLAVDPDAVR